MEKIEQLQKIVSQVRRDIVRMVHSNNSGHPGGSLGCTEFLVALYFEVMSHNSAFDMDGKDEDYSSFLTDIYLLLYTAF